MSSHLFILISDAFSGFRAGWIVFVLGAKVNPGLVVLNVFYMKVYMGKVLNIV